MNSKLQHLIYGNSKKKCLFLYIIPLDLINFEIALIKTQQEVNHSKRLLINEPRKNNHSAYLDEIPCIAISLKTFQSQILNYEGKFPKLFLINGFPNSNIYQKNQRSFDEMNSTLLIMYFKFLEQESDHQLLIFFN